MSARCGVVAVVLTHDRPAMLERCLEAVCAQTVMPDRVLVVDNASPDRVDALVAGFSRAEVIRLEENLGPAAGFSEGVRAALLAGAEAVWMMDDDGLPADTQCLARLLGTARACGSEVTSPLVRDVADETRLAFPIRQAGHTCFHVGELPPARLIEGFAHLFNGALIARSVFDRIGLPDRVLCMRGDEVEFMLRARRSAVRIVTDLGASFLHPSSQNEIHPILGGRFYAVVPVDARKRAFQFRNRGWIFSRYGLWAWLCADHLRYALHYLYARRDPAGYASWLGATWSGVLGRMDAPSARPMVGVAS